MAFVSMHHVRQDALNVTADGVRFSTDGVRWTGFCRADVERAWCRGCFVAIHQRPLELRVHTELGARHDPCRVTVETQRVAREPVYLKADTEATAHAIVRAVTSSERARGLKSFMGALESFLDADNMDVHEVGLRQAERPQVAARHTTQGLTMRGEQGQEAAQGTTQAAAEHTSQGACKLSRLVRVQQEEDDVRSALATAQQLAEADGMD
jgi:hypothetical protein